MESFLAATLKMPTQIKKLIVGEYNNLASYVNSLLQIFYSHFNRPQQAVIGCLYLGIIIAVSLIFISIRKRIKKYLGKEKEVNKPLTKAEGSSQSNKPKWKKTETSKVSTEKVEIKSDRPKPKWQKPQPIKKENVDNKETQETVKPKWKKLEGVNTSVGKSGSFKKESKEPKQDESKTKDEADTTKINEKAKRGWFGFGKSKDEEAVVCKEEKKGEEKNGISESFMSMLSNKDDGRSDNEVNKEIVKDTREPEKVNIKSGEDIKSTGRRFPTQEVDIKSEEEEEVVATWKPERTFHLNIDPKPRSRKEANKIKNEQITLVKLMGSRFREKKKMETSGAEMYEDKLRDKAMISGARSFFIEEEKRAQSVNPVQRIKLRSDDSPFNNQEQISEQRGGFAAGRLRTKDFEMFEEKDKTDEPVKIIHKKKLITLDQIIKQDTSNLDQITDWKEKELDNLKEARPTPLLKRWNPKEKHAEQNEILNQEIEEMKQAHPTPVVKRWKPLDRIEKTKSMEVPNKLKIDNFLIDTTKEEELKKDRLMEIDQICESRPTPLVKRWKPDKQEYIERSKSVSCVPRAKLRDNNWNINDKSISQEEENRSKTAQEIEQIRKERAEAVESEMFNISENKEIQIRKRTEDEIQEIIETRMQNTDEETEIGRKKEIELKQQTRKELEEVKKSRKEVPTHNENIKKVLKTVTPAELDLVKTARLNSDKQEIVEIQDANLESKNKRAKELEEIKVARLSNPVISNPLKEEKLSELKKETQKELEDIKALRVSTVNEGKDTGTVKIVSAKKESVKGKLSKEKDDKQVLDKKKEKDDKQLLDKKKEKDDKLLLDKKKEKDDKQLLDNKKELLKAKKLKKLTGIEEKKVKAAKVLISGNNIVNKEEQKSVVTIDKVETVKESNKANQEKTENLKKDVTSTKHNTNTSKKQGAEIKTQESNIITTTKTSQKKTMLYDHEEERTDEVNRRAKELAELALKLQNSRENQDEDDDLPDLQRVEVNQRLQELAQLAKCGTLDIAIAIAAESVGK